MDTKDIANNVVTMSIPVDELPYLPASAISPIDNPQTYVKPNKPKSNAGRPCEYCQRSVEVLKTTRGYLESKIGEKPEMIYISELAIKLHIDRDIIADWKNKTKEDGSLEHPQFNRMIKELETIQEFRLQQRLMSRYNPTGAIFLLKTKHKYIETEKQIMAGDKNEPLQIEFIQEKKIPDE